MLWMSDDKILESEILEKAKLICRVSVYMTMMTCIYIDNIPVVTCNKEPTHFVTWVRYYVMGINI